MSGRARWLARVRPSRGGPQSPLVADEASVARVRPFQSRGPSWLPLVTCCFCKNNPRKKQRWPPVTLPGRLRHAPRPGTRYYSQFYQRRRSRLSRSSCCNPITQHQDLSGCRASRARSRVSRRGCWPSAPKGAADIRPAQSLPPSASPGHQADEADGLLITIVHCETYAQPLNIGATGCLEPLTSEPTSVVTAQEGNEAADVMGSASRPIAVWAMTSLAAWDYYG